MGLVECIRLASTT